MSAVLADTHAIVWSLFDPPKLSSLARSPLIAATGTDRICISTITLVELNYLVGKKSFPYVGVLPKLIALIRDPSEPIEALPLTVTVAEAMDRVPRTEVPDMPDRIIAATAIAHSMRLVSADPDIQGSASLQSLVPVIW